ncbi:MAG: helix-turn-helix transcriptional regulator [Oscillospiraceae bacterium]|jgi:transcriptional regulator with XRE-family HTH domain|nr:helix-turn-helix transcriptional regulator [Oscillospiraceae bacterium]
MNSTSKDENSTFAIKLRELLEKHPTSKESTTKTALAKAVGVKQQAVSQWSYGNTTPELKHLKSIADYFNISIEELVTGVDYPNEDLNRDTGLSNSAIEILKRLKDDDNFTNRAVTGFLNLLIESVEFPDGRTNILFRESLEYLVKLFDRIKYNEYISVNLPAKERKNRTEQWKHGQNNPEYNELEFDIYKLTKYFEKVLTQLSEYNKLENHLLEIYKGNYHEKHFWK